MLGAGPPGQGFGVEVYQSSGISPAEILLGYNPVSSRIQTAKGAAEDWLKEGLDPEHVICRRDILNGMRRLGTRTPGGQPND